MPDTPGLRIERGKPLQRQCISPHPDPPPEGQGLGHLPDTLEKPPCQQGVSLDLQDSNLQGRSARLTS